MDHFVETEFFPALEKAIRLVDGIYNPKLLSQSSIPALTTALGPQWEVTPSDPGNPDRACAQRASRALPIMFKHPRENKDGQEVIRLIFDETGIQ